ncbi:unnamed protein product [Lymnaea stagnalis]|uniref:Uncharacterized protein n=1 Tax=Lymnaea stagnalis TaxID=6523 RepID=A0AAV2HBH0_LYMST
MLKKAQDYSWQQVPEKLRDLTKDYAITISHPHGAAKQVSIGRVLPRDLHESESVNKDEVENARLLSKLFTSCNKSPEGSKRLIGYLKFLDLKTPIQITKYSAATCEGSSGAPVYVGDFEVMNGQQVNIPRTHRGTREIENCFHNYSHV